MKRLIILISVSICLVSAASSQEALPMKEGAYTVEEVVTADSTSKSYLYSKAIEWFALRYRSANDVIQSRDSASGRVIGKGVFKIKYYARNPSIRHTIIIAVKDGKYKFTITGFTYSDSQGDEFAYEQFPKGWAGKKKLMDSTAEEVAAIVKDLKAFMLNRKTEDW